MYLSVTTTLKGYKMKKNENKVAEAKVENAKSVENTQANTQANGYKPWEERTNGERLESINNYYKMILAKSIGDKKKFWDKDMSAKEIDNTIPYNASTGKPYNGIISIALRAAKEINNYKDSDFLTMRQGNLLNGRLQKGSKGVKMVRMVDHEYQPMLDSKGNQIYDKDGRAKTTKVYLKEPKLETVMLYHTSQFDGLNTSKLKGRDLDSLKEFRDKQQEKGYDIRPNLNFLNMGKDVINDLNNFMTSQLKGIDYQKIETKSLSKIRREQQERDRAKENTIQYTYN